MVSMPKDYFPEEPFGCHGLEPGGVIHRCDLDAFDPMMRLILNKAREKFGRPLIINSGCRCAGHNAAVKGSGHSAHLVGPDGLCHAADIKVLSDITRAKLYHIFYDLGIRRFEVSNFHLHVDNTAWLPTPLLASVTFRGATPET
jgi:hypothetical protein